MKVVNLFAKNNKVRDIVEICILIGQKENCVGIHEFQNTPLRMGSSLSEKIGLRTENLPKLILRRQIHCIPHRQKVIWAI